MTPCRPLDAREASCPSLDRTDQEPTAGAYAGVPDSADDCGLGLVALLAIAGAQASRTSTASATAIPPAAEKGTAAACTMSWSVSPSPAVAGGELRAVAAAAPNDAWAVGGPSDAWWVTPRPTVLTEHWDGTRWTVVPSPEVSGVLDDVAIAAHNDAWAVGELGDLASGTGAAGALIEH